MCGLYIHTQTYPKISKLKEGKKNVEDERDNNRIKDKREISATYLKSS